MDNWRDKLNRIKQAQTEIMRSAPYRDFGLVPNPGASESAILRAESRLGAELPGSYRDFLASHDGWPRFYEGATLLGTANLGRRAYEDVVQAVFRAAETPVPDVGPPASAKVAQRALIPFGVDLQGTTLFAFDASRPRQQGSELPVVAWVNELGLTFSGFEDFLDNVLEWLSFDVVVAPTRMLAAG
jgi:hypothetical protein